MGNKQYTNSDTQQIANQIRKQILGIAISSGGCYLAQACSSAEIISTLYTQVLNLGPSAGEWEAIPFPGVPGPDNMDYQRGSATTDFPHRTRTVSSSPAVTTHRSSTVPWQLWAASAPPPWRNSTWTAGIWR